MTAAQTRTRKPRTVAPKYCRKNIEEMILLNFESLITTVQARDEEIDIFETLGEPAEYEAIILSSEIREVIREGLAKLSDSQLEVITRHYSPREDTERQIGADLGISRRGAQECKRRALVKLRRFFRAKGYKKEQFL